MSAPSLLYVVKHFPCLSQTFVLNEVTGLLERGCSVHVASALKLEEDSGGLDPRLAARTFYLEHDYAYPYAATGRHGDAEVEAAAERCLAAPDGPVTREESRRLWEVLEECEDDVRLRRRGLLEAAGLLAFVRRRGVTHLHGDFAEDNVKLAYVLSRATGVPFTFKMRAYDIFAEPARDLARWARAAAGVLTISRYNAAYLAEVLGLPRRKIRVVYDGVPVARIRPVREYRHRPFRVVSAARLVEKKGVGHLLAAVRLARDRGLELACEIFGDGPLAPSLRARAGELGLDGVATFHGRRPHQEVLEALGAASAVVLPCVEAANGDRDGTPNVLMEAMAREVPVVSTRLSGIPEIVEDGVDGLLVEPGDPPALARALERLHRDRGLAEDLRRAGRRKVEERFDVRRTVDELLDVVAGRESPLAAASL